jgi:hypothetical protein
LTAVFVRQWCDNPALECFPTLSPSADEGEGIKGEMGLATGVATAAVAAWRIAGADSAIEAPALLVSGLVSVLARVAELKSADARPGAAKVLLQWALGGESPDTPEHVMLEQAARRCVLGDARKVLHRLYSDR